MVLIRFMFGSFQKQTISACNCSRLVGRKRKQNLFVGCTYGLEHFSPILLSVLVCPDLRSGYIHSSLARGIQNIIHVHGFGFMWQSRLWHWMCDTLLLWNWTYDSWLLWHWMYDSWLFWHWMYDSLLLWYWMCDSWVLWHWMYDCYTECMIVYCCYTECVIVGCCHT